MCTLGPASAARVGELVDAGMDVARINFSHGTPADHAELVRAVRRASEEAGRPVGVLADLSGPKVRLGELAGGEVTLEPGDAFVLRPGGVPGDAASAPTSYPGLAADLQPGDRVLLADGAAELRVTAARDGEVVAEVVRGGLVRSRAGVNIPSERLSLPAVTDKDRADVARALDLGVDFVAQSFVRRAEDVRELRRLLGSSPVQLVAKIETRAAIDDEEKILHEADAVMLARGDLGVEIPFEEIPLLQKDLVRRAVADGVPVIVATQMLESMILAPRPTRAEASDVANAVLERADAILLSGETAIGKFPVAAAQTAARIAEAAERGAVVFYERRRRPPDGEDEAVAYAASVLTHGDASVAAVACLTRTGRTAALLSAGWPRVPVFAMSPDPAVVRQLSLRRAVVPLHVDLPPNTDEMVAMMDRRLLATGLVSKGALVLMTGSTPVLGARTNFLKVHRLG